MQELNKEESWLVRSIKGMLLLAQNARRKNLNLRKDNIMAALAQVLAKVGVSIGTKLMTERFISRMVILVLEYLVKSTKNKIDDELLEEVKKAFEDEK